MAKKHLKWLREPKPTVQLIAAILLFIISVQVSRGTGIPAWEVALFQTIYDLPSWLHPIFFVVTQFGSILVLALLGLLYLAKRHYHIVLRLLMTGTLAYLLSGVAKDLFGRIRPNEFLIDVINLDYIVRGPGFPSGHMALATAIALTIGHYLPKKYHWIVPVWIIGVGLSRVYLGIHFPLDILGGFAIGWASYALFRHVRLYDITTPRKPRAKTKTRKLKRARA